MHRCTARCFVRTFGHTTAFQPGTEEERVREAVLIVGLEPPLVRRIARALSHHGIAAVSASTLSECKARIEDPSVAVVVMDGKAYAECMEVARKSGKLITFLLSSSDDSLLAEIEKQAEAGLPWDVVRKNGLSAPLVAFRVRRLLRAGDSAGKPEATGETPQDRQAEQAADSFKSETERYRFFFAHMPVAAIVSDRSYTVTEWNKEAERLFGYPREEAVGSRLTDLLYSGENEVSAEDLRANLLNTLTNKERSRNINFDTTKDGKTILCEWFDLPYTSEHGEYILSVAKDITAEKAILDSLSSRVEQQGVMMREVHHRLKNNLSMMTSLINLRMQEDRQEGALQDIQGQLQAVSTLYEKLYSNGETSRMELGPYIEDLIYSLFTSLAQVTYRIDVEMEPVWVPPETAIHIGLIANEVATNAMKYGFADGCGEEKCVFSVTFARVPEREAYLLTLSNNGKPFPADVDLSNPDTLGLRLIETLVAQLEGSVELKRTPSATYLITIPAARFSAAD